ncbi:fatty acid desaturase family protein [Ekhidna sp.]|uniref:fatty acid desaturase family protein n=1 Tax=Ekhidna sp. TaxID=2608089 RepID=UPI003C7C4D11
MSEVVRVSDKNNQSKRYQQIVSAYFSREEIDTLLRKSDLKAAWEVFKVWFWIGFSFAIVAAWPNVLTVILALIIIGAKQLGCAIIMHDASHYALFHSKRLNNFIGNWFGAFPIIHNINQYRPYHLQHHLATGTDEDPDINLTKGYPTSKKSMIRKFSRDLSGVSGLKNYFGLIAMHLGILKYNLGNYVEKLVEEQSGYLWKNGINNLWGPIASNLIMLGLCWFFVSPWLYLLWPVAMLTTYMFILRIRSMAEHSMVKDRTDPLQNSRTIKANWLEKFLFAPLNVNYHLEHHLLFTVPSYNFKKMHQILKERGLYKEANYSHGYGEIIRKAASVT